jgi:hypothetical protein
MALFLYLIKLSTGLPATFDSLEIAGVEAAATTRFYASQTGLLSSLIDSSANLSYQQVDQRTGHVS